MRVGVAIALLALAVPGIAHGATVFVLEGGGWGHGVGMSQWGAEGYARHGYDYRRILAHYYPHTDLSRAPSRDVRVLLEDGRSSVRVSSDAPYLVVDARGRKVHLAGRVDVTASFTVRGHKLAGPLRFEAGAQPLSLGTAAYRGDLVVEPGMSKGLMAVNVVPLERYLRGVVPSEDPVGWQQATYEAQAVAARSYALASLHPGRPFDLYADDRSQVYGGIAAEQPWTNRAVGYTAGRVLTYGGQVITAYYFSTSGGRTSAVQDAFPGLAPEPYLVSVADPYDAISPKHAWTPRRLSLAWLGRKLGVRGVENVVVREDGSRHAGVVEVQSSSGWTSFPGTEVRAKLSLQSPNFQIGMLRLDAPSKRSLLGSRVVVRGAVRGLAHVQLERWSGSVWKTVAYVHTKRGRFAVPLRTRTAGELRLTAGGVPTPGVPFRVARR